MLPGWELLLRNITGYSGMSFLREDCLYSKVLGTYCSWLYLFVRASLSSFLCSSVACLLFIAAQLPICWATFSSYNFTLMAYSFCFKILRRVLCFASFMFSSACISSSAWWSSLYFLKFLSSFFSSSLRASSSPSCWSSSWTTWTIFCWRIYSCWTIFSF